MRFVTLFPKMENVHLVKDCGMIPYILYKYYGYDSKIVGYKNDYDYDYINSEVKGLKIDFLKKKFNNSILDSCWYIIKNNKKIDVLNLYHMKPESYFCALVYKMLNHKGVVYLKADNANKNIFNRKYLKKKIKIQAIKLFDVISSENDDVCQYFNGNFPVHFEYIPNGFYDDGNRRTIKDKENIILTVARIGSYQKANDVMLNGFAKASKNLPDWKLRLIGDVNQDFESFISEYFVRYPELKNRVEFVGPIRNREVLDAEYQKANIFTLTSIYEGFPIVFLEAIKSGCYIVTSDIGGANEITQSGTTGTIYKGNESEYANALIEICSNNEKLKELIPKIQDYAYSEYYWPKIGAKLNEVIQKVKK